MEKENISNRLDESRSRWNRRSHNYVKHASTHLVKNENNEFEVPEVVRYMLDKFDLNKNHSVIDIGCGPGHFDIVLSNFVGNVIGTDISTNMIDYANQLKKEHGRDNVEFKVMTLQEGDFEKANYIEKFDLVYATFTPAISCIEDFIMFASLTRKYGFLRGFVHRHNDVKDYIARKILHEKPHEAKNPEKLKHYIDYLWENGYYPSISYKLENRDKEYESIEKYIDFIMDFYGEEMVKPHIDEIKEYLSSIADKEGKIQTHEESFIYSLSWVVDGYKDCEEI